MKLIDKANKNDFLLIGFFDEDKLKEKNLVKTKNYITEFADKNLAYIYLGTKKDFDVVSLKEIIRKIVRLNVRNYQIEAKSFVSTQVSLSEVVNSFVDIDEYENGKNLYCAKSTKKENKISLSIIVSDKKISSEVAKTLEIAQCVNTARKLQATPPNICNSEWLAKEMEAMFKGIKNSNLKIRVLSKREIEKEKMGLLLSVNRGSAYEARLVVIEFNNNPKSKEKIALIGKGITFDSGGYNLKPSQHILGMKYDMSGAAICAAAMKGIVSLNPKVNVCAVLPLTDNRVSADAQLPDSIWTSMSGKTVEVNNTDAEGRLILADAITYAVKKLKPSQIIDVATLTGAIIVALGTTYTGTWSTDDKAYDKLLRAADKQNELIWRMPFHNDFIKNIKASKFADYKNTDLSGKGGSNSAAMFLKEFTEGTKYIHLDIAGTGGDGDEPRGTMVKTLIQFALDSE